MFDVLQVTGKFLTYFGYVAIAGAFYAPLLCNEVPDADAGQSIVKKYLRGCIVALIFAIVGPVLWFFAKTGALASRGIDGAFDPLMLKIVWSAAPGDALLVKTLAFFGALMVIIRYQSAQYKPGKMFYIGMGLPMVIAAFSSTLTGHIFEQAMPEHIALIVHIITISWWAASLPLLIQLAYQYPPSHVRRYMLRFGRDAWVPIVLLILTGVGMIYSLADLPEALYHTLYGNLFMVKASLVLVMLCLATWHKWFLVPRLVNNTPETVVRSIQVESIIALIVLLTTAVFTTFTGPHE